MDNGGNVLENERECYAAFDMYRDSFFFPFVICEQTAAELVFLTLCHLHCAQGADERVDGRADGCLSGAIVAWRLNNATHNMR